MFRSKNTQNPPSYGVLYRVVVYEEGPWSTERAARGRHTEIDKGGSIASPLNARLEFVGSCNSDPGPGSVLQIETLDGDGRLANSVPFRDQCGGFRGLDSLVMVVSNCGFQGDTAGFSILSGQLSANRS